MYSQLAAFDGYNLQNLNAYEQPQFGLVNLGYVDETPVLGLMNLKNTIDHLDAKAGAGVSMDFSKGASNTLIKSGHLGNVDDLKIKQGVNTGIAEMKNIQGISRDNMKEITAAMHGSDQKAKDKAESDTWKLNEQKEKAMDNWKILMNLKNTIDHLDAKAGAGVSMDFSKGASNTLIKSGHLGDVDDLHIKQGKNTGVAEMKNIQGASRDNMKEITNAMHGSDQAAKDKAQSDTWKLNEKKEAAMDNWKVVLLI